MSVNPAQLATADSLAVRLAVAIKRVHGRLREAAAGLVRSAADPSDGRKSVISVTPAGNRLFESAKASRDAWLARAIGHVVSPRERAALEKSIELLERLADAERQES